MHEAVAFETKGHGVPSSLLAQPGGSFHLPPELVKKFPVLLEFMKLKMHMAQIMAVLNSKHGHSLQPLAAKTTLDDLRDAQQLSGDVFEILCLVSCMMNKHSMVCHPVGCHVDTFAKKRRRRWRTRRALC
jgi:hypothetical protein